ncbi:splicing factor YJU2-like [Ptychodera flava]|uniref:splicing factor YJU2-like n=1 Tax=Ptychodera flava TaxID=63121 RepID=UPI003969BCBA
MSERKVLNKYYPPDFDPSKIPKLKLAKDRQYTVRLMAPFNMRCKSCHEYIYKGKKFNARKETVQGETYLGLAIFRFYIKCPRCVAEITFKTDPENTDYALEEGATRNFQAEKLIQEEEERIKREREEEEMNNPMKVLENRTRDSKMEMEIIENLEELRDLNMRHGNVDHTAIIEMKAQKWMVDQEKILKKMADEEEAEVRAIFGRSDGDTIKRLDDEEEEDDDEDHTPSVSMAAGSNKRPTDFLTEDSDASTSQPLKKQKTLSWERSVGGLSKKSALSSLVKVKSNKTNLSNGKTNDNSCEKKTVNESKETVSKNDKKEEKKKADDRKDGQNISKPQTSSLSLLGAYSDSESGSDCN